MTKDLANLDEINRALDDIRMELEYKQRMLNQFKPENSFEEEAFSAYTNVVGRLKTIRHALERRKDILEES